MRPVFAEHFLLQYALEDAVAPLLPSLVDGAVQGRFALIAGADGGVVASGPRNVYPLRLPGGARPFFRPGRHASLVLVQRALGWAPAASSLPMEPDEVEARMSRLRREAAAGGHLRLLGPDQS